MLNKPSPSSALLYDGNHTSPIDFAVKTQHLQYLLCETHHQQRTQVIPPENSVLAEAIGSNVGYIHEYDGLIGTKGNNIIGHLAGVIDERVTELYKPEAEEKAIQALQDFAAKRGQHIDSGTARTLLADETLYIREKLALHECCANSPIVVSTSGNNGLAADKVIELLRDENNAIPLNIEHTDTLPIFAQNEGKVFVHCPASMPNDKLEFFQEGVIKERTTLLPYPTDGDVIHKKARDISALVISAITGGMFLPTNPKLPSELENLAEQAKASVEKSFDVYKAYLAREAPELAANLEQLDKTTVLETLDATTAYAQALNESGHIMPGGYGLMTPVLRAIDDLLYEKESVTNLPENITLTVTNSGGSTLGMAVRAMDDLLLEDGKDPVKHKVLSQTYPSLSEHLGNLREAYQAGTVKINISTAHDIANPGMRTSMERPLTDNREEITPTGFYNAPNGASTASLTQMTEIELQDSINKEKGVFSTDNIKTASRFFEEIARLMEFADNIRSHIDAETLPKLPEQAGAVNAAALLRDTLEMYDNEFSRDVAHPLTPHKAAYLLRREGIDLETMQTLLGKDSPEALKEYLTGGLPDTSAGHAEYAYINAFLESMDKDYATLTRDATILATKPATETLNLIIISGASCQQPTSEMVQDIKTARQERSPVAILDLTFDRQNVAPPIHKVD